MNRILIFSIVACVGCAAATEMRAQTVISAPPSSTQKRHALLITLMRNRCQDAYQKVRRLCRPIQRPLNSSTHHLALLLERTPKARTLVSLVQFSLAPP